MQKQYLVSLESLVPQDHFVRKLENILDFAFIQNTMQEYINIEKTSDIDPQFIARYMLIIHLYDLERPAPIAQDISERVEDSMRDNVAYRWFIGASLTGDIPGYNEVMQAREKFGGKDKWDAILNHLLCQCAENGLPDRKGGAMER